MEAVARLLRPADVSVWDDDRGRGGRESPLWARRCARRRARAGAGLLAARPAALRARPRDDLRGLPRPLRPPAALRAGRRRHGAAARRLPLRARARPGRRRPASVDAVADLAELISALRAAPGRAGEGDGAAWAATAALLGRAARAPRGAPRRRDPAPLGAARERGDEAVDRALPRTPPRGLDPSPDDRAARDAATEGKDVIFGDAARRALFLAVIGSASSRLRWPRRKARRRARRRY